MAITFEHVINMTTYDGNPAPSYVENLKIANEPSNAINQFYLVDTRAADKNSDIVLSNYNDLQWDGPNRSLTSKALKRFGIKSYPQQGAMAFYSLLHEERSFLLCPVFVESTRYTKPFFSIEQHDDSLTFHMKSPDDITYICWRVILRIGYEAFEYVTYEDTLTVENPYISGDYICYCVGYTGEGEAVSDDSDVIELTIVGSGDDPLDVFSTYTKAETDKAIKDALATYSPEGSYTKAEIDAMLGNIAAVLDKINGEVV